MDLFRDKQLYTKEYYEKKPVTPEEETLTQQLNLTPIDVKAEEAEEEKVVPGLVLGHEVLNGKIVGLYFSAGWCPPCQQFTPLLGELYEELKNRNANFEVVFLSFDKNAEEMETYFRSKHKDWYVLPFDDPMKEELKIKYNITAVPKLIIVHRNGDVITSKGRKEVKDKGVICFRNWQQTAGVLESRLSQATDTGVKKETTDAEQNEEKKKDAEHEEISKFQGYLTVQPPLWTIGTSSSRQCAIFCVTDVKCASFYYKQTDGCKGFEGVISSDFDFRRISGWRYYVTCKVTREAEEESAEAATTTLTPPESKTPSPTAPTKQTASLDEETKSTDTGSSTVVKTTTMKPAESKTSSPTAEAKPSASADEETKSVGAVPNSVTKTETQTVATTAASKTQGSFQQMDFAAVGRR